SAEAGQKITSREAIVGKQEERRKGKAIARSLDAASAAKGSSVLNLSGPLPEPFSWFRSDSAFASNVPNPNVSDSKRAPAPARDTPAGKPTRARVAAAQTICRVPSSHCVPAARSD